MVLFFALLICITFSCQPQAEETAEEAKPVIDTAADIEAIEGMVVNIDIPIFELGWGGIQLEDTILVTSDGFELLTSTDRTMYLL